MRIPRVFVPGPLTVDTECVLPETALRHVVRALRLQPGAELIVFDGRGGEYQATLARVERNGAWVRLNRFDAREAESTLQITLVQGISRGERMDYAIQKAVELGVHAIVPVFTERSVVQLKGDRVDKRQSRWQTVAQSACEQCGRNRVPQLYSPLPFSSWLDQWSGEGPGLALDPQARQTLTDLPLPQQPVTILVGPEGGLTDDELTRAGERGFQGVRLGPRVLRTETAAAAILTAAQVLWGDLR